MAHEPAIKLQLLPDEQALLLKYGYPFEPEKKQLERLIARNDIGMIAISPFYLDKLIGDLCYSINKRTRGRVQQQLIDLCDRLEYAERTGDGMLDCIL
jgi:hypothetical protein